MITIIHMSKIHLISGPRNISTALMYSFGNRMDMTVIDEPFYGYYLDIHPEIDHPGRSETLASMPTDYRAIITEIIQTLSLIHISEPTRPY